MAKQTQQMFEKEPIVQKKQTFFCAVLEAGKLEWVGEEFLLNRTRFGKDINEQVIDTYTYQVVARSPMKCLKLSIPDLL